MTMMKSDAAAKLLRRIPKVDRMLDSVEFAELIQIHSRPVVSRVLKAELGSLRDRGRGGELEANDLEADSIRDRVEVELQRRAIPYYRRVINGTGVILHTGLGRAPLPQEAVNALAEHAGHPMRVEIDLESGDRGGRDLGCAELLKEITGCEAATVVNNNAGATLLVLAALARDRGVVVSRGELVEIGGSYRVPAIMEESGARLVEVGTTNRTHLKDYEAAINEDSGMILKVHTSNYRIEGFTKEVEIDDLVALGRKHELPVVHDLGSGCLIDLEARGLHGEPFVSNSLGKGADLVCFSGDKLLGGPQSGIILGTNEAVAKCKAHQLFRALRPCRLTYAALESVLRIYLRGEDEAISKVPALGRLLAPADEMKVRAKRLAKQLGAIWGIATDVVRDQSFAGSGSLPTHGIPTWSVCVSMDGRSTTELARHLRTGEPAILARTKDDVLLFDVRTLQDDEFDDITARLASIV